MQPYEKNSKIETNLPFRNYDTASFEKGLPKLKDDTEEKKKLRYTVNEFVKKNILPLNTQVGVDRALVNAYKKFDKETISDVILPEFRNVKDERKNNPDFVRASVMHHGWAARYACDSAEKELDLQYEHFEAMVKRDKNLESKNH